MRARLADDTVELAAALWRLDLQSELVWNGDTGGTEASGATRRYGLELEGRWQPLPWLWADLDVSLAKSRYKTDAGNGNAVALAPPLVITGGVSVRHPSGLTAALRLRHIGDRPASQLTADDGVPACTPQSAEDERCYLTAQGYLVLDGAVGYETRRFGLTLFVENLTGTAFREAQFGNVSRAQGEPYPVQDVHFTPGNPFGAHLAGTFRF
jgi:outer membrane receptor protein involved in Fe transport